MLRVRNDQNCRSCDTLDDMSELVSTEEAASRIGVAYRTLLRWAKRGQVKAAMSLPSGQFRWDVADLRRQLDMPPEEGER